MELQKTSKKIQALLFFFNEAIQHKKLAKLLGVDLATIKEALEIAKKNLSDSGIKLIVTETDSQLVANIEDESLLDKLDTSSNQTSFTPAVIETLAIISYLQPVTEDTIDLVRGVRSGRTIKKLLRRGYLNFDKGSNTYNLSADAFRQLGFGSAKELPHYDTITMKLKTLAQQQSND